MVINVRSLAVATVAVLLCCLAFSGPAVADSTNYGKTWQTKAGARIHGYVQFKASHVYHSKHVKRGYVRLSRKAGPALDTGRIYTSTASSKKDSATRKKQKDVWDSPLWGDSHTTHFYYGFSYFG